jgi:hypothetical protein
MVTPRLSAASIQRFFPRRMMLRAARLLFSAAAVISTVGLSLARAESRAPAGAQSHRAHLSDDLTHHLNSGDATGSTVIVIGTAAQVDAIVARHGLRVHRRLASGAVLDVPPGRLSEVAADPDVPQLSGDHVMHGQTAVTDFGTVSQSGWVNGLLPGRRRPGERQSTHTRRLIWQTSLRISTTTAQRLVHDACSRRPIGWSSDRLLEQTRGFRRFS